MQLNAGWVALLACAFLFTGSVRAQTYPSRAVRIVRSFEALRGLGYEGGYDAVRHYAGAGGASVRP